MLRVLLLCILVVGTGVAAVVASATPPSGIASAPVHARGSWGERVVVGTPVTRFVSKRVRVRVRGRTYTRRVRVRVRTVEPLLRCQGNARCDTAFQQLTINPGGTTGWHNHPGVTVVAVAQGEGTLYRDAPGCPSQKYGALNGFFQSFKENHVLRNEGSQPLTVWAFYAMPAGSLTSGIRGDQPRSAHCPNIG